MTTNLVNDLMDKSAKMSAKIKETWTKLNDEDIKLYADNRNKFFSVVKEKQNIIQEEAEKMLKEFDKACCCATDSNKAA